MEYIGTPKELSQLCFELDPEKKYKLTEYKEQRGTQANRYFHKLCNLLARYNRSTGYAISDEEIKKQMNLSYGTLLTFEDGKIQGCKVPKGTDIDKFYPYAKLYKSEDNCDCYIFYKRTHELDSKEFYQLIKGVEQECKNVGIPTLEDREFEEMMKNYETNN